MAFVFDAGPQSATMNSYTTVDFADDYFTGRYGSDLWTALGDADQDLITKQSLLVYASNIIDTFTFAGYKSNRQQPLMWPRTGLFNDDGAYYSPTVVPVKVQQAACEMALWKLTEQDRPLDDIAIQQYDNFKAGPLTLAIKNKALLFPHEMIRMLTSLGQGILVNTGSDGSGAVSMTMKL